MLPTTDLYDTGSDVCHFQKKATMLRREERYPEGRRVRRKHPFTICVILRSTTKLLGIRTPGASRLLPACI